MTASYVLAQKKESCNIEECQHSPVKRSRLSRGVFVGVVGIIILFALAVAAFYAGTMVHKAAYKTAWFTLINSDDARDIVTEKVVVTDTEADVIRPGDIRIILDTENGYLTFLKDTQVTDGKLNPCYVVYVDVKGHASDMKAHLSQEHVRQVVPFSANTHEFELTDEPVDPAILSSRTKELCFGRDIMKAYETTAAVRSRRAGRVRLLFGLIDIQWGNKEK